MTKKKITEAVTSTDAKTKRWKFLISAAKLAYQSGEFSQAAGLLARAELLASDIPEHSFAVNATAIGQAALALAQNRKRDAASLLTRAIAKLEGYSDNGHRELLAVARRFNAKVLLDNGDVREAEKELQRSATILRELGSEAVVQLAYTMCDLCGLYLEEGRSSEAEHQMLFVMKVMSTELGPEAPEYVRADMMYQLSRPMAEEQRVAEAHGAIEKVEYSFGAKHPDMKRTLDRYLRVLETRGDTEKIKEIKEEFGLCSNRR